MANTTSGTVTFDKTFSVDEIIGEAYERIGLQSVSGLTADKNGNACATVTLNKVWYSVSMTAKVDAVKLTWDADTDATFLTLEQSGFLDYSSIGGVPNNKATNYTGDVKFVMPACTSADSATITCEWLKNY